MFNLSPTAIRLLASVLAEAALLTEADPGYLVPADLDEETIAELVTAGLITDGVAQAGVAGDREVRALHVTEIGEYVAGCAVAIHIHKLLDGQPVPDGSDEPLAHAVRLLRNAPRRLADLLRDSVS